MLELCRVWFVLHTTDEQCGLVLEAFREGLRRAVGHDVVEQEKVKAEHKQKKGHERVRNAAGGGGDGGCGCVELRTIGAFPLL